jgi:hypothetical protein
MGATQQPSLIHAIRLEVEGHALLAAHRVALQKSRKIGLDHIVDNGG